MKERQGFTLSEVLITMAIIGVVAALTIPSLITNIADQKTTARLAKFDNTFSTAIEATIYEMRKTSITNVDMSSFVSVLCSRVEMVPLNTYTFSNGDRTVDYNYNQQNNQQIFQLKDGTILVFVFANSATPVNFGNFKGPIADIIVDTNGNRGPNIAGIDVFGFILDGSGALIPASSEAHRMLSNGNAGDSVNGVIIGAPATCSRSSGVLNRNLACTGAIADNHWSTRGLNMD